MAFSFNKSFFAYVWAFGLAIVLSISPVQNISASISTCMKMENSMQHGMHSAQSNHKTNMASANHVDKMQDCCDETKCESNHCAGTTAAITSDLVIQITYSQKTSYQTARASLTSFYPSTLYRPPKV